MKKIAWLVAFLPVVAWAQSPFDGTWVGRMESTKITGKPDTYLVADGRFTCEVCVPTLTIRADGTDQKVTGHAYYDTAAARIVDAQTVEMTTHRAGKLVAERKLTVSADGKTMTESFVAHDGPAPSTGKLVSTRVAAGPPGSHALSGSWQPRIQDSTLSADQLTVTYQGRADGLKMSSPTGVSFDAKFDGKAVLAQGDPGKTMVSLKRIDDRTIEETDTRMGKVTDVIVSKVGADGKSMHVVDDDKLHGTTTSFTAEKH